MTKTCSIPDCEKAVFGRGWCNAHYKKWWRYGDPLTPHRGRHVEAICAVDGCDDARRGKSEFCNAHYRRNLRHGDPLGGSTPTGEPLRFLEATVLPYAGDDCLIWPFCKNTNGYGQIWIGPTKHVTSRLVCEKVHGPPPTPEHHAAHSCGKGHFGCVNPNHLRWATVSENHRDKLRHGTQVRGGDHKLAKLTVGDVREIRALRGVVPQRELADRFGVAQSRISKVQRRTVWAWLDA